MLFEMLGLFIHLFVILLRFGSFIVNEKLLYAPQAIMSGRKGGGSWKYYYGQLSKADFLQGPLSFESQCWGLQGTLQKSLLSADAVPIFLLLLLKKAGSVEPALPRRHAASVLPRWPI